MNNLDHNRFFFCPTSTTLAEELDKIFQRSPSKHQNEKNNDVPMVVEHLENTKIGPKLNKMAMRRESGVASRNHVSNKIILQKNASTHNAPLTQRNSSSIML